ncbi:hypothetical protein BDK51DRAFT_27186 [Blyttiomyces helicus]|uniref:DDE Tnp4 domain-containing protein n=1 Tax=Blyttiomyces helicus TaxID=388810 RepID=A0A4P9WGH6_9FUNG|nr:hypothetical protein BDK51DRAFT_27186 [Blyttiomyces helicus]|eukprot:RKO89566.1 hypothetical protein BDK51DRAFT_27186 [Blyttiomyces helicus]
MHCKQPIHRGPKIPKTFALQNLWRQWPDRESRQAMILSFTATPPVPKSTLSGSMLLCLLSALDVTAMASPSPGFHGPMASAIELRTSTLAKSSRLSLGGSEWVKRPNKDKRAEIARHCGEQFRFEGAEGGLDGTDIVLAQRPAIDREVFFGRKKYYRITTQVMCDHRNLIRLSCLIVAALGLAFTQGKCLLVDSVYTLDHTHMLAPYKMPSTAKPSRLHPIDIMRRLKLESRRLWEWTDFPRLLDWIGVCVILHNMVTLANDSDLEWEEEVMEICLRERLPVFVHQANNHNNSSD